MKVTPGTGTVAAGLELAALLPALVVMVAVAHAHTAAPQQQRQQPVAGAGAPASHGPPGPPLSTVAGPSEPATTRGGTDCHAITDDSGGKSVVVNWKLTCQQLCSAGYGGPPCGSAWGRTPMSDDHGLPIDESTAGALCPTLCSNGLGIARCSCTAAMLKGQFQPNQVCAAFCAVADVQLHGCSRCDGNDTHAIPESGSFGDVQTTTPNWDELCGLLCKAGDGGTLCNCDLPPFF